MLVLLPEDEKPDFSSGDYLWTVFQLILENIFSESISDPRRMALRADKLWMIHGRSVPVQALSEQFEDVYALPRRNSSTRSVPRFSSRLSVPEDDRRRII